MVVTIKCSKTSIPKCYCSVITSYSYTWLLPVVYCSTYFAHPIRAENSFVYLIVRVVLKIVSSIAQLLLNEDTLRSYFIGYTYIYKFDLQTEKKNNQTIINREREKSFCYKCMSVGLSPTKGEKKSIQINYLDTRITLAISTILLRGQKKQGQLRECQNCREKF